MHDHPRSLAAALLAAGLTYAVVTEKPAQLLRQAYHALAHRGLESRVHSAFRRLEPAPDPSSGVEAFRIHDHTIYITGGEETKASLTRAYCAAKSFLDHHGGKPYIDEHGQEQTTPELPRIESYVTERDPERGIGEYNKAIRSWAQSIHLANASLTGGVHYGIVEGQTPGTPLTPATAKQIEEDVTAGIENLTTRLQSYRQDAHCRREARLSRYRMPEGENRPWSSEGSERYSAYRSQPSVSAPRGMTVAQYHQWRGSTY